jgi:thioesterase domain-containing protein
LIGLIYADCRRIPQILDPASRNGVSYTGSGALRRVWRMPGKSDEELLNSFLFSGIPIADAMGLQVISYGAEGLTLSAPLGPNRNDKGTAFAGSIYSAAVLAGWGLVTLGLREAGLDASVVVKDAEIRYLVPVVAPFTSFCASPKAPEWREFLSSVKTKKGGKITLAVEVTQETGKAARFEGLYAAFLRMEGIPLDSR